jgi:hypothetical protein
MARTRFWVPKQQKYPHEMGISDDYKIERRSTTAAYSQGEAHNANLADEVALLWYPREAANG